MCQNHIIYNKNNQINHINIFNWTIFKDDITFFATSLVLFCLMFMRLFYSPLIFMAPDVWWTNTTIIQLQQDHRKIKIE